MNLFCSLLTYSYLCRMQDDERKIDSYKTLKVYQKTICVFDDSRCGRENSPNTPTTPTPPTTPLKK